MKRAGERVFIDTGVFLCASASAAGGSAVVMSLCRNGRFTAVTTDLILEEARASLKSGFGNVVLTRFYKMVSVLTLEIFPPVNSETKYAKVIGSKDAHVLAAAVESGCGYLIMSGQNRSAHAKLKKTKLPVAIITPKDFIKKLGVERLGVEGL